MNLRGLRYFAAVAHARSFTYAASELNVAQPAVSRQIQLLERELGVRLLTRSRTGVRLTGAGDFFLKRALPLIVELDQAKAYLLRQSEAQVGDVVIGLTAAEGLAVAPTLIRRWGEMFPAATLKIVEGLASVIHAGLHDESINIGIAPEPLAFDNIWTIPLFEEPLVLIAPNDPCTSIPNLSTIDTSDIQAVLGLPLIGPSNSNPLRRKIDALSKKFGIEANICIELDSMPIIKDLVRRGNGYALTTHAYLQHEIEHDLLRVLKIDSPDVWRTVCLFGLKSESQSTLSSVATEFIRDIILDIVVAGQWPGARPIENGNQSNAVVIEARS